VPVVSPTSLLVLQASRLAGFAPVERVAAVYDLDPAAVARELAELAAAGFATHRDGRRSGWSLTPAGRAEGERRLAAELDAAGVRDEVTDCYRAFTGLNPQLLAVCTDWQLRDPTTLNDHTDPDHDAAVVATLARIDAGARPVCARLATCLDRFGRYPRLLGAALARVEAGEGDWFTRPTIASYHTVWFELHEDLLATLNLDRATENRA